MAGARKLRGDTTASLSLLPLALLAAVSFSIMWTLTWPLGRWQWHALGVWALTFPLLLLRPVERALLWQRWNIRRLSEHEMRTLRPLWERVMERAGADSSKFMLAMQEHSHPNAFAAGRSTVAVTSSALHSLPGPYLEAVLAHEYGHHVGAHTLVSAAAVWLMQPVLLVQMLMRWSYRTVAVLTNMMAHAGIPLVYAAGWVVLALFRAFSRLLWVVVRAGQFLLTTIGRQSEHAADRVAVHLGYGPALAELFCQWDQGEQLSGMKGRWQRRWASHPTMMSRVRNIERQIRRVSDRQERQS